MFNFLHKKKKSNALFFRVSKYVKDNYKSHFQDESPIRFSLKPKEPLEPSKEEVKLFAEENVNLS